MNSTVCFQAYFHGDFTSQDDLKAGIEEMKIE